MNLEHFNKLWEVPPLQNKDEWRTYLEICESHLKEHKIKNPLVVELGIWKGKQRPFYEQLFGATYIGIDRSKKRCRPDIQGISTDPKTLERLEEKLAGRSINILFIDARHEYKNVGGDFKMYGPLCNDIIAFHDVNYPSVMRVWNELKIESSILNLPPVEGREWKDKNSLFILIEKTSGIGMMIKR